MLKKILAVLLVSASILTSAAPVMADDNELPIIMDGIGMIKKALPFEDVAQDAWYYDVIAQAYNMNLIKGMSDTEFSPESSVTGAQLVTMLYRAAGNTTYDSYSGNWYDETVNWAKGNGIIADDNGWDFEPEADLTREQMMVLLYKYMIYKGKGSTDAADLAKFTDSSDISDWAKSAIAWLVAKACIVGDGETLRPHSSLTRAETATILVRAVSAAN